MVEKAIVKHHRLVAGALSAAVLSACSTPDPRDPAPGNAMPTGYLDVPRDGETVGRLVEISGWAADDANGVRVRIYVDHRFVAATDLTIARPDVSAAFPQYARDGDRHGWRVEVDLGPGEGPHVITAQAVDDDGAVRDLQTIGVKVIARDPD